VRSPQADRHCEIPAENAGTVEGQAVEEVFGRNGEEGSEVTSLDKAHAQGVDAYWDGYGPNATQYTPGSELFKAFQTGWIEARAEAEAKGQAVPGNKLPYR